MQRAILVLMMSLSAPTFAFADDACRDGERRLQPGVPCIPATMYNYLICLSSSGGGRIEVSTTDDSSGEKKFDIKVAGAGEGVIVKAGGSVTVGHSDASRAVKKFSETFDKTLAANCKDLATLVGAPQPAAPPKTAMGPLLNGVGLDHSDIDASGWLSLTSAEACRDVCYTRSDCKAMTYVNSNRSCWLKYEVPKRSANRDEISSIKQ